MISVDTLSVAPWAHTELLIAIVSTIGVIGSSAAAAEWIKSRRKRKISADEHESAAAARAIQAEETPAEELVTAAMTIVGKWEEMVTTITDRHEKEMAKRDRRHESDLRALNRRLDGEVNRRRRFERMIHEWWAGVTMDWERVRQDSRPPEFPTTKYDPEEV